ncbi:MAG TPA: neutral/alkaline non-lysosomal ceramidase N-terminal domain-containing protein [Haliangium sp.]|nr:neutral/alkaline non-lysosomal ceramidase N-terminal domain-containing protein [Haliangium sp.]
MKRAVVIALSLSLLVAACAEVDLDTMGGDPTTGAPAEKSDGRTRSDGAAGTPDTGPVTETTCAGNTRFDVGAGVYDITGPAAEVGMMGYASVDQKTTGIHMRLRSRAFVISTPCNGKRVAFVSADLGQVFQAVKQKVVERLRARYGDLYSDANVMISATHTHSGPGGHSHYALYNLSILGFDPQGFEAIVDGIYKSIVRAHDNVTPGAIRMASGQLLNASFNRSPLAYAENPPTERAAYAHDTDKDMTVLRLDEATGAAAGMISWFAVHATNIGNENRLISGDNKGLASYLFERRKGTSYTANKTFVAAFANSNEGDVSPNLWGVPDLVHDFERNAIIGNAQLDRAQALYDGPTSALSGGVNFRHVYVNFSQLPVAAAWTDGAGARQTCRAAIGVSMVAGAPEDGPGVPFIPEGMVWDGVSWPPITIVPEDQACQDEKVILLPSGNMTPYPWTPEVLPVQIATIGNLALVAVPFEATTMAGRRLREMVAETLAPAGVTHVVIAGLANAYAGYMATREEFALQHYEGASTHFGPYSLAALMQETNRVAVSLRDGTTLAPGPTPRDLTNDQSSLITGVVFDDKPLFVSFGSVETNAAASYLRGQTARAVFWGGHPKNNLKIQGTFLEVQRNVSGVWTTVARDWDPETRYIWQRDGIANSKVTIEWDIPQSATPGQYRLVHSGHWKSGWTGVISPYTGTSRTFTVQ